MKNYGMELILDLHKCDAGKFNRKDLRKYCKSLCVKIDMTPCKLVFWDDVGVPISERQTSPHTKGTSAVQFILTSNITIHTLDLLGNVYINIFSCKKFDSEKATKFTTEFFNGKVVNCMEIKRR